ncbi:MAG: prepilin-type N-terminal cleavage/methylation domain-containing protein [Candidatus Saccharibacteria bacterium]|nr:prepilin-type N-terminal cleavage/methylation domain-containing protein [Candidatus Saccharibacteria bacterium]
MKATLGKLNYTQHQRGFTIVELLIVIVIIGILAALVIVAYNGITQRAENSKTISAVSAYQKALLQYMTEHGEYPRALSSTSVWANSCLGEGYSGATCWNSPSSYMERTYFNNEVRTYMGKQNPLPLTSTQVISGRNGAAYFYGSGLTVDGVSQPNMLIYVLNSSIGSKCPVGPIIGPDTGYVWPNLKLNPSSGRSEVYTDGIGCFITLPNSI